MAVIQDLLKRVADAELRARLEEEIGRLAKHKKFGLVFEEHLPECTPLYDVKISRGTQSRDPVGTRSKGAIRGPSRGPRKGPEGTKSGH